MSSWVVSCAHDVEKSLLAIAAIASCSSGHAHDPGKRAISLARTDDHSQRQCPDPDEDDTGDPNIHPLHQGNYLHLRVWHQLIDHIPMTAA